MKAAASAPTPPTPPQSESGSVEALGTGESETNLSFRPSKVVYEITEQVPGAPSCNPTVKAKVKISQFPVANNHWAIRFDWENLVGVNVITWTATA